MKVKFKAKIEHHKNMDAAYVVFPYDVFDLFGTNGQVKIKTTFDKKIQYRGSLAKMEHDFHFLGLTKEIRKELNKSFGDIVDIELEKDGELRIVTIPDDVSQILKKNENANDFFQSLSYTNRKEYIRWIESARKEETRQKRLEIFQVKMNNKNKFDDK